ncbi:MAG: GntR family transcriptional regulator [Rubrivivax sp.]
MYIEERRKTPRGNSVEQVAQRIRDGILRGRYAQGQRLIERDLIEETGFGRSTVREAFGRLASEGLVELVPNRGATVRRLSRQELVEHFQIRELLEGLAARLAAGAAASHAARPRATALLAELRADPESGRDFQDRELALHRLLLELGGGAQLARLLSRMHVPLSTAQVSQALSREQLQGARRAQLKILQAVTEARPDDAEAAMRLHLRQVGVWMQAQPDAAFGADRRPAAAAPPSSSSPS